MPSVRDKVVSALRKHPNGMTTKAIAEHLNRPISNTSSMLSKSVYYGYIDREYRVENGQRFAIWKARV